MSTTSTLPGASFALIQSQINMPLFTDTVHLVLATTRASKKVMDVKRSLAHVMWYEQVDLHDPLTTHGIRYVGELLERYQEKLGDTPQNLRAIALALACTVPLLTENLFVDRQQENFMQLVRYSAGQDVYLACALSRLEPDEQSTIRQKLMHKQYSHTDELLVVLQMFLHDQEVFDALRPQLIQHFGIKRTIPAEGNAGVYAWLLKEYMPQIQGCRKADNAGLRALVKLAISYVRETDKPYEVLRKAGYTPHEIIYLNTRMVWELQNWRERIDPNSIPAEKMATAYVVNCLNSAEKPSADALAFLQWLLGRYERFAIRYQGHPNLWDAAKEHLNIICPDVMIWMINTLDQTFCYRFDVLDSKWDVLASAIPAPRYHGLFRSQLLHDQSRPQEEALQMLDKYQQLTGISYIEALSDYSYHEDGAFAYLVNLGAVDLWDFFQANKERTQNENAKERLQYVWHYAYKVKTRQAFAFWKRFFAEYTADQVPQFWPGDSFHHEFAQFYSTSVYRIRESLSFKRDFLTREENRELFEWIDASVFTLKPKNYLDFALSVLMSDAIYTLFDLDELKPIFISLSESGVDNNCISTLKKRFLSEDELAALKEAEARAELERKEAEALQMLQKLTQDLKSYYDGTLQSLLRFISYTSTWNGQRREAVRCVCAMLPLWLAEHPVIDMKVFGDLLKACELGVEYGAMNQQSVLTVLQGANVTNDKEEKQNESDDD